VPSPSSYAGLRNPVGTHVQVGKGLVKGALVHADEVGAETVQVFAGNPRGWAHSAGDPSVDRAFRAACETSGMRVFIHTPYLVNLGSPTPSTYEKSVASVAHNLKRAVEIGAEGVVVHTGSCVDEGTLDAAMRQVREGLLPVLDAVGDDAPWLLLEPTAGQGRSLCAGVDDLEPYLDALDRHPGVGICLDTCHAYSAGYDLVNDYDGVMAKLQETLGLERLRVMHLNDSKTPFASRRDRHELIAEGSLGETPFRRIMTDERLARVPKGIETPKLDDATAPDTRMLQRLRGYAAAG
jgi:deoxyribonuclease-4